MIGEALLSLHTAFAHLHIEISLFLLFTSLHFISSEALVRVDSRSLSVDDEEWRLKERKSYSVFFRIRKPQMKTAVMIATAVFSESKPISAPPPESEFVECDCCQLAEECTPGYIESVREQHRGWWICGLCADAVAYEMLRSERELEVDEALLQHMKLCEQFRSSPPMNPAEKLISAVKHLLKRTLSLSRKHDGVESVTIDATTEGKIKNSN